MILRKLNEHQATEEKIVLETASTGIVTEILLIVVVMNVIISFVALNLDGKNFVQIVKITTVQDILKNE